MNKNHYIDIDIDIENPNTNNNEKISIKPICYLFTVYIMAFSIGEIYLSYQINSNSCKFFIDANIWFFVQGILSLTYLFLSYIFFYYKYRTDILQKISFHVNTQENFDLMKVLYYGVCCLYQFFIVLWIVFGTILLLMSCNMTTEMTNISVSVLFMEYIHVITFMKLIFSIKLIEN